MAKPIQKKKKLGYVVYINRSGEKKDWQRVEMSFRTKLEAFNWVTRSAYDYKALKIQAVRVNAEKLKEIKGI